MKTILLIFSSLIFCWTSFAQEVAETSKMSHGIELGSAFSYSGFNANLAYAMGWKENVLFVGPKISLSKSYLPSRGPWGIHLGYRRLLPRQSKWNSFASLEYQIAFLQPQNPYNLDINGKNEIHEIHLSYGIQFEVLKDLIIGNSIGAGVYFERFFDSLTGEKKSFDGYNAQVRLFAQYSF